MKSIRIFIPISLILITLACETSRSSYSGSVVGGSEQCTGSMSAGTCKGSYDKVSGTYVVDIETDHVFDVYVEAMVSIESGSLRVGIETNDGEIISSVAQPGSPALISGKSKIEDDYFGVILEVLEDDVTGLEFTINYRGS